MGRTPIAWSLLPVPVILKPCPDNVQDLYLASLEHLGINLAKHDVRFVEDDWSRRLGGVGPRWEVWIDGMESPSSPTSSR